MTKKKLKVYIVLKFNLKNECRIIKVFSKLESAQECLRKLKLRYENYNDLIASRPFSYTFHIIEKSIVDTTLHPPLMGDKDDKQINILTRHKVSK